MFLSSSAITNRARNCIPSATTGAELKVFFPGGATRKGRLQQRKAALPPQPLPQPDVQQPLSRVLALAEPRASGAARV